MGAERPGAMIDATVERLLDEAKRFPPTRWHGVSTSRLLQGDVRVGEEPLNFVELELGQHYAALAVYSRELWHHSREHGELDLGLYRDVLDQVHAIEMAGSYSGRAFPDYHGLPVETLPTGLVARALAGAPTLEPLQDEHIVHEWTALPGRRLCRALFRRLGGDFRRVVCGKSDTPRPPQELSVRAVIPTLVTSAFHSGFSAETLLLPILALGVTALALQGLDRVCEWLANSTVITEGVSGAALRTSAAAGAPPAVCLWEGKEYSPGAVISEAGYDYECAPHGAWVRVTR